MGIASKSVSSEQASPDLPPAFALSTGPVSLSLSGAIHSGTYASLKEAFASFQFDPNPSFDWDAAGAEDSTYIAAMARYETSGELSGSHPIGLVTGKAGLEIGRQGTVAVVHRVSKAADSGSALKEAIANWRLPRQVAKPADLPPGTWVLADAGGSLTLNLTAQLGYDVNLVRQLNLLNLSHTLSVKIDAGIKAMLGLHVSGRHLLMVGREADDQVLRLRLFGQSGKGSKLGLSATVALMNDPPKDAGSGNSLLKALMGLHPVQLIRDLLVMGRWTDPKANLLDTVARLSNDVGLALLSEVSGVDVKVNFTKARDIVLGAIQLWSVQSADTLPRAQAEIIAKLQSFVESHIDLSRVDGVKSEADFQALNPWLLARLGDFLDQKLDFPAFMELKNAIATLREKLPGFQSNGLEALAQKYRLNFAAIYEQSTGDTALLDVSFEMDHSSPARLFRQMLDKGECDRLLTEEMPGVILHKAALSHELRQSNEIQLHLPFFDARREHINRSLATLKIEQDAGRVLAYQVDADDTVTFSNRSQSQLALYGKFAVVNGRVDTGPLEDSSIAYQSLHVKAGMQFSELEYRTSDFLRAMFPELFSDQATLTQFYVDLHNAIAGATGQRDNAGDVGLDFRVALPGVVLAGWLVPRSTTETKKASMVMSRALQSKLRALIPMVYLQDLERLQQNAVTAPLLVWSCLPPSSSIDFNGRKVSRWDTDRDVFWDWRSVDLRRLVAYDARTAQALTISLQRAQRRWAAAGNAGNAEFFAPGQIGTFLRLATTGTGDELLQSLLFTESEMVHGAEAALRDLQGALTDVGTAPSRAIQRLAQFAAQVSATFHKRLSVYGSGEVVRTFNSMLLTEASRAIAPEKAVAASTASLSLFFLSQKHSFRLTDFLEGTMPPTQEIAFSQTFTNSGG